MPGPMPPQGPPPGPQGPPPGAGAPPPGGAPPGGSPGGGVSQLLMNVDKAIDQIKMVISNSKAASEHEKQMIGMIDDMYGKLMTSLGGEPDSDDGPPGGDGQGQTVPPEAGGNKGAIPSPM